MVNFFIDSYFWIVLIAQFRWLIQIKNNSGHITEPWMTPQWICYNFELKPFILIYYGQLERCDEENQLLATPLVP